MSEPKALKEMYEEGRTESLVCPISWPDTMWLLSLKLFTGQLLHKQPKNTSDLKTKILNTVTSITNVPKRLSEHWKQTFVCNSPRWKSFWNFAAFVKTYKYMLSYAVQRIEFKLCFTEIWTFEIDTFFQHPAYYWTKVSDLMLCQTLSSHVMILKLHLHYIFQFDPCYCKHCSFTGLHVQTNSSFEIKNRLISYHSKHFLLDQTKWETLFPSTVFSFTVSYLNSTGYSLIELGVG